MAQLRRISTQAQKAIVVMPFKQASQSIDSDTAEGESRFVGRRKDLISISSGSE
jgi:hypothetical protein